MFFDKEHAQSYDERFARMAPIKEALHFMTDSMLSSLKDNARILIIGAGTGAELAYLAERHPNWRFVAVEPSEPMFRQLQARCNALHLSGRCTLFHGFLDALQEDGLFDGACALLVSHFLVDKEERRRFFQAISKRLKPEAPFVTADLSADLSTPEGESLLERWFDMMAEAEVPNEKIAQLKAAFEKDVSVLAPEDLEVLIRSAGFGQPLQILQTLLIRAWITIRIL